MTALLKCARWYASQGFKVFPTAPKTKIPLAGSHGYLDAAADASPWTRRPDCNIGLSCIGNRLVLVDEDDPGVLAELGLELPSTWTSYGRRGPGRWYRVPEGKEPAYATIKGRLDIKWRGFGLVPPSIHPDTRKPYEWDPELRPGKIQIAAAPSWLVGIESSDPNVVYESDGEAVESFLGVAFAHLGMLGNPLSNGKYTVACPWEHEHSQHSSASSTVIFAPAPERLRIGTWHCSHSHCADRRTDDVIAWLPKDALVAAALAGYRRELAVIGGRA